MRAIYIALAKLIYGIMKVKRTQEVRPAILVRESNTQFLRYSLDTRISYYIYILYIVLDFQVSERLYRGPGFYYNYLINYTIGFVMITS